MVCNAETWYCIVGSEGKGVSRSLLNLRSRNSLQAMAFISTVFGVVKIAWYSSIVPGANMVAVVTRLPQTLILEGESG